MLVSIPRFPGNIAPATRPTCLYFFASIYNVGLALFATTNARKRAVRYTSRAAHCPSLPSLNNMSGRRPRSTRQTAAQPSQAAPASAKDVLAEAETLQQRAERRRGADAAPAYAAAAAKFEEALSLGLTDPTDQCTALLGLGECTQMWADAGVEATRRLPDDQLSAASEQAAEASACGLYERSVAAYERAASAAAASGAEDGASSGRADAAVNAGKRYTSQCFVSKIRIEWRFTAASPDAYRPSRHVSKD